MNTTIEYREGGYPGTARPCFVEARIYNGAELVASGRVDIPTWTYLMPPVEAGEYRGAALAMAQAALHPDQARS